CLQEVGKADEASRLDAFFPSQEELERQQAAAQQKAARRNLRLGWLVTVVNAAIAFACPSLFLAAGRGPVRLAVRERLETIAALGFVLLAFVGVTVLCRLACVLGGLVWPALRFKGSTLPLLLALMPWLGWLCFLVLTMIRPL